MELRPPRGIANETAKPIPVIHTKLPLILVLCPLAAIVGGVTGSAVDPLPLRWGSNLQEYIARNEGPVVSAKRMHARFEATKRTRVPEAGDYLSEENVIYLEPVGATVETMSDPAIADRQPMRVRPVQAPQAASLSETHSDVEGAHRMAQDGPGPKIIHFSGATENDRQATQEDWHSAAALRSDQRAQIDPTV